MGEPLAEAQQSYGAAHALHFSPFHKSFAVCLSLLLCLFLSLSRSLSLMQARGTSASIRYSGQTIQRVGSESLIESRDVVNAVVHICLTTCLMYMHASTHMNVSSIYVYTHMYALCTSASFVLMLQTCIQHTGVSMQTCHAHPHTATCLTAFSFRAELCSRTQDLEEKILVDRRRQAPKKQPSRAHKPKL